MKIITTFASSALLAAALTILPSSFVAADTYAIDTKGAHAFVQFRIKHLGYSWLYGRFNSFDGNFVYDPKDDSKNTVSVTADMSSLDSNHAERDKHLRAEKFLNTDEFPKASFVSTKYETVDDSTAKLTGDLTLMGVTKSITLDVENIGGGKDPWGGFRHGFEGRATINAQDSGMKAGYVKDVDLIWSVEGIRQ